MAPAIWSGFSSATAARNLSPADAFEVVCSMQCLPPHHTRCSLAVLFEGSAPLFEDCPAVRQSFPLPRMLVNRRCPEEIHDYETFRPMCRTSVRCHYPVCPTEAACQSASKGNSLHRGSRDHRHLFFARSQRARGKDFHERWTYQP